jgi:hypothetical protein
MIGANGFTPTEARIFEILSDGLPHRREDLHKCLPDELSALSALRPHLTRMRDKLQPKGFDILCVLLHKQIHYQLVHTVYSANDGRT